MASSLRAEPREGSLGLDACYQAHRHEVYRLCLRYGGGRRAWAEDLTHDVFVKLLEHLPRLRDTDDLGGWLYRVTANLCISRLRKDQSFVARFLRVASSEEAIEPSAANLVEDRQSAAAAWSTLQSLPARERVVLSMKVLDGKSQKEIATMLEMSEGYVSKLLARAWTQVRAAGWEADRGDA